MLKPIHIGKKVQEEEETKDVPFPSQIEEDKDSKIKDLEEQVQNLLGRNYVNQLGDDKIFRVELLQNIEKISASLNALVAKLDDIVSK